MKILATASMALLSTVLLADCGGDSDSSGTETTNDTPTKPIANPANNQAKECRTEGVNVYATDEGCLFSTPKINSGDYQTYVCNSGRVSSNGISAASINLNGITIQCES